MRRTYYCIASHKRTFRGIFTWRRATRWLTKHAHSDWTP